MINNITKSTFGGRTILRDNIHVYITIFYTDTQIERERERETKKDTKKKKKKKKKQCNNRLIKYYSLLLRDDDDARALKNTFSSFSNIFLNPDETLNPDRAQK